MCNTLQLYSLLALLPVVAMLCFFSIKAPMTKSGTWDFCRRQIIWFICRTEKTHKKHLKKVHRHFINRHLHISSEKVFYSFQISETPRVIKRISVLFIIALVMILMKVTQLGCCSTIQLLKLQMCVFLPSLEIAETCSTSYLLHLKNP